MLKKQLLYVTALFLEAKNNGNSNKTKEGKYLITNVKCINEKITLTRKKT